MLGLPISKSKSKSIPLTIALRASNAGTLDRDVNCMAQSKLIVYTYISHLLRIFKAPLFLGWLRFQFLWSIEKFYQEFLLANFWTQEGNQNTHYKYRF